MTTHLHIISFDNPYPPDYGGAIDVYFKLKWLHTLGYEISLHAYTNGRKHHSELDALCKHVFYYPRKFHIQWNVPYIVSSRNHPEILAHLTNDTDPILFEGLHSTALLSHPLLAYRKKLVRMHNIEHDYYHKLAYTSNGIIKRMYCSIESLLLKRYEPVLQHATRILAISKADHAYFSQHYQGSVYLPPFHSNDMLSMTLGMGNFAFYHGNLAVGENDQAARFLVRDVFSKTQFPFIIAGNQPSTALKNAVAKYQHIKLLDKLSTAEIAQYTRDAHVNVIPTFQDTGVKLKLINVLYQGKHVLTNTFMVKGSGLEPLCHIADTGDELLRLLNEIQHIPFTEKEKQEREHVLSTRFSNAHTASLLHQYLTE